MGRLLGAYLFPHPPIIVKEIGRGEEKKVKDTVMGVERLAEDIKSKEPTTIILITPHGPVFSDAMAISFGEKLEGSFKKFGKENLRFNFKNNKDLVNSIFRRAGEEDIAVAPIDKNFASNYNIETEIDHGALVPLYFVNKNYEDYNLIHITYGMIPSIGLYRFGTIIQEVVLDSKEEVVFIASGDLSHKLSNKGPYNYSPYGRIFDEKIVEYLKKGDFESIASFDIDLGEKAGECGLRSLITMAGFLDGFNVETDVYSYEGPFGVGYCTAKVNIVERNEDKELLHLLGEKEKNKLKETRKNEDEYVSLARKSLENYIKNRRKMGVPKELGKDLIDGKAGIFVTIKKDGQLRGCIGTTEPIQNCIAEEIIKNAISAGTRDTRFPSIYEEELEDLVYSVDVLKEAEKINSTDELDVERYGVIVSKGFRKGLLLPKLEGVDTPEEQVKIALLKAGISEDEEYSMERFEVERHS